MVPLRRVGVALDDGVVALVDGALLERPLEHAVGVLGLRRRPSPRWCRRRAGARCPAARPRPRWPPGSRARPARRARSGPVQPGLGCAATPTGLSTTTMSSSACSTVSPATTSAGPAISRRPLAARAAPPRASAPAASRSDLPAARPSTATRPSSVSAATAVRDRPEQPGQPGVHAHAVEAVGHREPAGVTHGRPAACLGRRPSPRAAATRVPSSSRPSRASSTSSTPPVTIEESARLNTGHTLPSGANSDTTSTTWPCSGPGERKIRSTRLPSAPPSTSPSATAQPVERSRRATRTITTTTATATSVSTHV